MLLHGTEPLIRLMSRRFPPMIIYPLLAYWLVGISMVLSGFQPWLVARFAMESLLGVFLATHGTTYLVIRGTVQVCQCEVTVIYWLRILFMLPLILLSIYFTPAHNQYRISDSSATHKRQVAKTKIHKKMKIYKIQVMYQYFIIINC